MPTMYYMTFTLTAVGWTMMITSPGWANLLVFYYLIFIIILYQDIKPILLQSLFSGGSMTYFFIKHKETVFKDVGYDQLAFFILYIIAGIGIFIIMCILAKKNYNELEQTNKSNEEAKKQAEVIIDEINNTGQSKVL